MRAKSLTPFDDARRTAILAVGVGPHEVSERRRLKRAKLIVSLDMSITAVVDRLTKFSRDPGCCISPEQIEMDRAKLLAIDFYNPLND